jgi:hypothetical protein
VSKWAKIRSNPCECPKSQVRLTAGERAKARTWSEIQQAQRTWCVNYTTGKHDAHQARQDGRQRPSEVLRGVLGRILTSEVLSRALFATRFTRQIDRHGFVKFKH